MMQSMRTCLAWIGGGNHISKDDEKSQLSHGWRAQDSIPSIQLQYQSVYSLHIFFCFILSDRMAKSVPSLIGSQPDPSEDHEPTAANEP